ncbi:MAG: UDP-N-acetylglucosamine pyrophosphorylase [Clostridia bacterium]|nr:UDP-N-acetylglucosamine pyrophosphorylase [Clostridia bacterium]
MNKEAMSIANLYDLSHTMAKPLMENFTYPWEVLPLIGEFILGLGETLPAEEYERREGNVWIARSAKLYPNIYIAGPTIIGPNTEVRPGAFIRGNALIGAGCVVGNSTEIKNAILFDGAQAPHYNYIGDSILGYKAHTGAGAITSNLKQDHSSVTIRTEDERVETGLRKFGAMLGDHVEVGCGSVLNPGTVIGRSARIYPLSMVRGFVPGFSIYKRAGEIAGIRES